MPHALHVRMADEAVRIGPAPASQSYIVIERIIEAIRATGRRGGASRLRLSLRERADFAAALAAAGVAFIGPPVGAIEAMGDKITSKKLAAEAGVSTVPGSMGLIDGCRPCREDRRGDRLSGDDQGLRRAAAARACGSLGRRGGARGLRAVALRGGVELRRRPRCSSRSSSPSRATSRSRCSATGTAIVIHLGERECSIQRRNQKVIEEAPSPFLDAATRRAMGEQAVALARAVDYCSAGTVEFIVDGARNFYFLEMNTRLQVEHPVTELITGIDLVEQMIRVAAGEKLAFGQTDVTLDGWAIESRLYAEDPYRNFLPSIGRLTRYRPPAEIREETRVVRNDTGVFEGGEISMFYDPMIAKLCTWAPDRAAAIDAMCVALDEFEIEGIGHNLPFLSAVMEHPRFRSGEITTAFIAEEYPEGFSGVSLPEATLRDLAALSVALHHAGEKRAARISGRLSHHERHVGDTWVVGVEDRSWSARVVEEGSGPVIAFEDGGRFAVSSDHAGAFWDPVVEVSVSGRPRSVKVDRIPGGYRLRYRGADSEGLGALGAARRTRREDAAEGAAGHFKAVALPDAGAGGAHRRGRRRRGLRRAVAGHDRGDEDGERAARRTKGAGGEGAREAGRQPRGRCRDPGVRVAWPRLSGAGAGQRRDHVAPVIGSRRARPRRPFWVT